MTGLKAAGIIAVASGLPVIATLEAVAKDAEKVAAMSTPVLLAFIGLVLAIVIVCQVRRHDKTIAEHKADWKDREQKIDEAQAEIRTRLFDVVENNTKAVTSMETSIQRCHHNRGT